jgi:hypothetical protein
MPREVRYVAGRTGNAFHADDSFMRALMGPIGSGKSTACAWEMFRRLNEQRPSTDGVRRARGLIVRNTYRELQDTVLPTWESQFRGWGEYHKGDQCIVHRSPGRELEVMLRALDKPGDVKKLLSLELTFAWVNECREIPGSVIDMLQGRVGRYPARSVGGPTWRGVFMDTNPPDELSWFYRMFEKERPAGWKLFRQPSALGANAENVEHLDPGYYERIAAGKSPGWRKVYLAGEYGFVGDDGRPMFPEYSDQLHCREFEEPTEGVVYVGLDFGLTPAATFATRAEGSGAMRVHRELVTFDMGAAKFAGELGRMLRTHYPPHRFQWVITGDPSGDNRDQADEMTPYMVLAQAGIAASPAYTNEPSTRRDAVGLLLRTLTMSGQPGLLIHPRCLMLRQGMNGGYRIKRLQVVGADRYSDKPEKNEYSHVCEALEYGVLGAGEGNNVVTGGQTGWLTSWDEAKPRGARQWQ